MMLCRQPSFSCFLSSTAHNHHDIDKKNKKRAASAARRRESTKDEQGKEEYSSTPAQQVAATPAPAPSVLLFEYDRARIGWSRVSEIRVSNYSFSC